VSAGASKPEPHPEALIRGALSRLMIPDYEASAALDVLVGRLEQAEKELAEVQRVGNLTMREVLAERKRLREERDRLAEAVNAARRIKVHALDPYSHEDYAPRDLKAAIARFEKALVSPPDREDARSANFGGGRDAD
jgi:hypothetical protein